MLYSRRIEGEGERYCNVVEIFFTFINLAAYYFLY